MLNKIKLNEELSRVKEIMGIQEQTAPSQYKVGKLLNTRRSTDGQMYTIKIKEVGDGYVMADINGPGQYNGKPLKGTTLTGYKLSSVKPGELSGDSEMGTFRGKQAPLILNSTYEAIRSTDKQKYQITPKRIYTDSENDYNGYMANIVGPGTYQGDGFTAEDAVKYPNGGYDLTQDKTNVIGGNTEMGDFTIIRKIK